MAQETVSPVDLAGVEQLVATTDAVVREALQLARTDWDSFETSWDFQTLPVLQQKAATLSQSQAVADAEAARSNQQNPLKASIAEADKPVEASPTPTLPIATGDGERFPYTRTRLITEQEAAAMSYTDLRYAINEMYARHGADFSSQRAIANLFRQFEWYHPRTGVPMSEIENEFSETERANVLVLAKYRDQRRASGER
jgi:hypothetical protein